MKKVIQPRIFPRNAKKVRNNRAGLARSSGENREGGTRAAEDRVLHVGGRRQRRVRFELPIDLPIFRLGLREGEGHYSMLISLHGKKIKEHTTDTDLNDAVRL